MSAAAVLGLRFIGMPRLVPTEFYPLRLPVTLLRHYESFAHHAFRASARLRDVVHSRRDEYDTGVADGSGTGRPPQD